VFRSPNRTAVGRRSCVAPKRILAERLLRSVAAGSGASVVHSVQGPAASAGASFRVWSRPVEVRSVVASQFVASVASVASVEFVASVPRIVASRVSVPAPAVVHVQAPRPSASCREHGKAKSVRRIVGRALGNAGRVARAKLHARLRERLRSGRPMTIVSVSSLVPSASRRASLH
jgi:hypothetical protein